MYQNFGDEVTFTLNPFVFGSESQSGLECFDESSPCTLEQESMNVISSSAQSVYVPWLVCMDSNKDNLNTCDSQVGISKPAKTAPADILDKFFKADSPIQGTPTVYVEGKNVKTSYNAIHTALCKADPSLTGCSSELPLDGDEEITKFCRKPSAIEV